MIESEKMVFDLEMARGLRGDEGGNEFNGTMGKS